MIKEKFSFKIRKRNRKLFVFSVDWFKMPFSRDIIIIITYKYNVTIINKMEHNFIFFLFSEYLCALILSKRLFLFKCRIIKYASLEYWQVSNVIFQSINVGNVDKRRQGMRWHFFVKEKTIFTTYFRILISALKINLLFIVFTQTLNQLNS